MFFRLTNKPNQCCKKFYFGRYDKPVSSISLDKIELEALKSEIEVLSEQLFDYEALKLGAVNVFKVNSLQELPMLLIQARIAQGLTQR